MRPNSVNKSSLSAEQLDQAWAEYGANMRRDRLILDLSIRDVAERSGVSKNTILRLESGKKVQRGSLLRICRVYNCAPLDPLTWRPATQSGTNFKISSKAASVWFPLKTDDEGAVVQIPDLDATSPDERARLGHYRLVEFFSRPLRCRRENSRMIPFVMELYGKTDASRDRSGERFAYCLQGRARITVGDESFILEEGDSAMFDGCQLHFLEPASPIPKEGPGCQVLLVYLP